MTQSIFYSILFFGTHDEHHHNNNDIMFYNCEEHLIGILSLYGKAKITVCVCCKNKRRVLDKLQRCSNVASIIVCTKHHNEQEWSTNHHTVIRQSLFEDPRQWEIEAHTDALNANVQKDIISFIQSIILKQLFEQNVLKTNNTSEEGTSSGLSN